MNQSPIDNLTKDKILKIPRLLGWAWMAVLTIRLIPIGGIWDSLSNTTWFVIFLWVFFYFSAMLMGVYHKPKNKINIDRVNSLENAKLANYWIKRLSIFSVIGAALICYEFAVVRGYGFTTPVAEIRIMEVNAYMNDFGGSWISGLGRMLTPALMLASIISISKWRDLSRYTVITLAIAVVINFYEQMMFEGGRFYFAALGTMLYITSVLRTASGNNDVVKESNQTSRVKKRLLWLGGLAMALGYFAYVFIDRINYSNRDYYGGYREWAKNFGLDLGGDLESRLTGSLGELWVSVSMLWAYVTHGISVLDRLLNGDFDNAWGLFQFPQVGQVLNKLMGANLKYDVFRNLEVGGTYTTLYGASYVDFGHVGGMVFIIIIGWFTGRSIKKSLDGSFDGLSISAPVLVTLGIFSPIVSLIPNLWPAFLWALAVGILTRIYFPQKVSEDKNSNIVYDVHTKACN